MFDKTLDPGALLEAFLHFIAEAQFDHEGLGGRDQWSLAGMCKLDALARAFGFDGAQQAYEFVDAEQERR